MHLVSCLCSIDFSTVPLLFAVGVAQKKEKRKTFEMTEAFL